MKFLSIDHLTTQASDTFKRFPLSILFAVTGSFTAVGMIAQNINDNSLLIKLLFTCILALPFTVGATLYAERQSRSKTIILSIAMGVVALYGVFLAPGKFGENDEATITFFVLCLVMHLWVAIAPYTKTDERLGFWKFNETLYVRMFIAGVFSVALFAGLSLALYALKNLLQFAINDKTYPQLWVVIVGIFNTWFFLGGVPEDFAHLNTEKEFPKGLKIFTQYILIPLATIYLVILYAYGSKIMFMWNLPKGWVSMLVMWYSVIGILAVLLVYPLRNDDDKPWVKLFSRFFFIAMLPVTVLLFVAIGARIRQYGITEPRYYLIALGVWMVAIALYFILSKSKNIKAVPATLILLGIFSLFGPWNAFSVSSGSQRRALEKVLVTNKIWDNGQILHHGDINDSIEKQTRRLLWYFVDRNKEDELDPIFRLEVARLKDTVRQHLEEGYREQSWAVTSATVDTLMEILHLRVVDRENVMPAIWKRAVRSVNGNSFLNVEGYNYVYYYSDYDEEIDKIRYRQDSLELKLYKDKSMLVISNKNGVVAQFSFIDLIKNLQHDNVECNVPEYLITIKGTGNMEAIFKLNSVTIENTNRMAGVEGYILMK